MEALARGELAQQGRVNCETIRYYERRGLLPKPPRTPSGYRVFSSDAVRRVRFIKRAQGLGFSLKEIKALLALRVDPCSSCVPGIVAALLPSLTCPLCWPAYAGVLSSLGVGFVGTTAYLLPLTATFLAIAVGALTSAPGGMAATAHSSLDSWVRQSSCWESSSSTQHQRPSGASGRWSPLQCGMSGRAGRPPSPVPRAFQQ